MEDNLTCSPGGTLENQVKVEVRPIPALSLCELHLYQPEIRGICHIFCSLKCILLPQLLFSIWKWQLAGNALCLKDKRRIQSTLFAPSPVMLRRYLLNDQRKIIFVTNFIDKDYSVCASIFICISYKLYCQFTSKTNMMLSLYFLISLKQQDFVSAY